MREEEEEEELLQAVKEEAQRLLRSPSSTVAPPQDGLSSQSVAELLTKLRRYPKGQQVIFLLKPRLFGRLGFNSKFGARNCERTGVLDDAVLQQTSKFLRDMVRHLKLRPAKHIPPKPQPRNRH